MNNRHHHIRSIVGWIYISLIILLSCPAFAGVQSTHFSNKGENLLVECEKAISSRQFEVLANKGRELTRLGQSEKNHCEEVVGEAMRLHAMISMRDTSDFTLPIEILIKEAPGLKGTDDRAYGVVTRTISSYYQRILNDYSQALHYATETLDAARETGNRKEEASALATMASIYFQKQDASGWSYAVESYELAKEIGDISTRYVTSCNMANYLYNNGKIEDAMKYLQEARDYATRAGLDSEDSYINSFLGDIYNRLGQPEEAERHYLHSLSPHPSTSKFDMVYSNICYSMFLIEHDRLNEALGVLNKASDMAERYKVSIFAKEIYALMSRIYEEQGDYARSLDYYKRFTAISLEVFSEQKEREFAILDLRNKVSEEERKNASQSVELLKRGRTIIILSAIGILFLLICVAGFFYHRHKMADYKDTVARYLENAKAEKLLREQLEAATVRPADKPSGGLNDEKSTAIFQNLERLMREEHIYRDSSLSLDKASSLLTTNRTYLSQVVNEKSGKSFSNYVNEYRLNEAVEILSDPDNNDQLKDIGSKVGFTSQSNFYTLFRQRVGVSPSIFRSNVKNI